MRVIPVRDADHRLARYRETDNLMRSQAISERVPAWDTTKLVPGLSVVVLNLDKPELIVPLMDCLADAATIFAGEGAGFELLIGDTSSTNERVLAKYAAVDDTVKVISGLKFHFSACNNAVVRRHASYDKLLFLNNDVVFESPNQIWEMYRGTIDLGVSVTGLALDYPDSRVQHIGIDVMRDPQHWGLTFHPCAGGKTDHRNGTSWDAMATTGACLMIDAALWQRVGGFDEAYAKECQDVDLCLAAQRLGARLRVMDVGTVIHLENATRPTGEESWEDRRLLMRRWQSFIEARFL
jgi:GT2 family glycosyltransferase